jgi:hypothetical protein
MISISDFKPKNNTVSKYTYRVGISAGNASPVGFTIGAYIFDTKRAHYGYTAAGCNLVGVGFKLIEFNMDVGVASTSNVNAYLSMTYDNTHFTVLGTEFGGSTNTLLFSTLRRSSNGTIYGQTINAPCEAYLIVTGLSGYASAGFTYQLVNAATQASINNTDIITMVFEITEYVSTY